jgi:hypothetical protein
MPENSQEVPTLTNEELNDLLDKWQRLHGNERINRQGMPYFEIRDYVTAMNSLVLTFIGIGYSEKQIRSEKLSLDIQRFCTPYKYEGKLKEWRIQIERHWMHAVRERFPSKFSIAEAQPIEQEKAKIHLEKTAGPPPIKIKENVITKPSYIPGKGFGKVTDKMVNNDPLADLDGDDDE